MKFGWYIWFSCPIYLLLCLFVYPLSAEEDVDQELLVKQVSDDFKNNKTIEFLFAAGEEVHAASFLIDDLLYIVFDRRVENNVFTDLQYHLGKGNYDLVIGDKYSMLKLKSFIPVSFFRGEKNGWIVDLEHDFNRDDIKYVKPEEGKARVFFRVNTNAKPVVIEDFGSSILILPCDEAVAQQHNYVHFNLLKSTRGVALDLKSDAVEHYMDSEGMMIAYPKIQKVPMVYSKAYLEDDRIFNFERFVVKDRDYVGFEHFLRNQILEVTGSEKLEKRFDLVKFYMANGLYHEARYYLEYMKVRDFTLTNSHMFNLLFYAISFLLGNGHASYDYFRKLNLKDFAPVQQKEIEFWKRASAMSIGINAGLLEYDEDLMEGYVNKEGFLLLAFQAAIENVDDIKVAFFQEILRAKKLKGVKKDEFLLLMAQLRKALNDNEKALEIYNSIVGNIIDRENRMAAIFFKTKLLYEQGEYTREKAVEELQKARVLWKGNRIDAELRFWLSELLILGDDYHQGLIILRSLYNNFPHGYNIFPVLVMMSDVFLEVFVTGKSAEMSDFEAVALFLDFQNLLPIGEKASKVIAVFINHLIKLDLLDAASLALTDLVNNRIGGALKDEKILDLARVYLKDKRYEDMLTLLDSFASRGLGDMHLRSRALIMLEQYDEAEKLLGGDDSEEGDSIRSDIFWYSQNWGKLIELGQGKLEYRTDPEAPLSKLELQLVFRLASAYIMVNDRSTLMKLYDAFKDMMDRNLVYKESFDLFHRMTSLYDLDYTEGISELVSVYTASLLDENRG